MRVLSGASDRFAAEAAVERAELAPCSSCGAPTTAEVCAFCRLVDRAARVELSETRR